MSADDDSPVVLITGASQGIGAALARAFARRRPSARLALVARREEQLESVAQSCRELGAVADAVPCDVSDEQAVQTMVWEVEAAHGRIDVLINNAGGFAPGSFLSQTVEEFDRMIATNLRSVFLVSRAVVPGMVRRGRGDVFNMSSIAGLQPYLAGAAYCAAKFGVTGLSKVMRAELRETGVRVCTVYPGATMTPSWEESGVPAERLMPAEDVAEAFVDIFELSRRTVVEEIILRPQRGDL